MKHLLTLAISLMTAMTLFATDVDAKRFGGGKSFGKSYSNFSKPKTTSAPTTTGRAAQPAGQAGRSGASRWLGPLAGLAAGGLLAAMLFGDGFEGLQIMDMLLFAALIFGGVMLFRMMRAKSARQPQAAGGVPFGGSPLGKDQDQDKMQYQAAEPAMGSAQAEAPAWFDGDSFVQGAKTHFIRLQAAWDKGDFRDIRDYTTPEMFAELQNEYQRLGGENQYTEVMMLNAQLLGSRREGDQLVVSVHYTGMIREEKAAEATDLSEIWHVTHAWDSADGAWYIAGIQQTND